MNARRLTAIAMTTAATATLLSGCAKKGEIVVDSGVGITAVRSHCPAVGIPDYTGDMTLFRDPAGPKTESNLDLVATMTDVRSTCDEASVTPKVNSQVTFKVEAIRRDTHGARQVTLPYYFSVLQGGTSVVSKRVGQVTLNFADGAARATATGQGTAYVDRAAATLPEDIRAKITEKRKAGDADAAVDPLTDPKVKAAVATATFEVLLGFQLNNDQLAYNVTR
ncbi:hypothetical protein [Novosphingobium sp. 9]|uniref:hypothetical protein n=1 Tax=Novosphingobium sp. 9 TaxID=2025349 RepID=UPI0021B51625|nr:hypothetical protein [Novosphingobium sp. 9]